MSASKVDRREQGVEVERHLAAAVEYIAVAESGDAEKSAYEHAADEIIAAQAEDSTLSNVEIGRRVGKSRDWVRLLVQWRTNGDDVAPFGAQRQTQDRNVSGARTTARNRPDDFAQAFEDAPPEAKRQIAERISHDPDVRAEARKRDQEFTEQRQPSPIPPRADSVLYEFEAELVAVRRRLRNALSLANKIDTPGNDEDILDLLAMLKELVDANDQAYRSGQSLDAWAWELYEKAAD